MRGNRAGLLALVALVVSVLLLSNPMVCTGPLAGPVGDIGFTLAALLHLVLFGAVRPRLDEPLPVDGVEVPARVDAASPD